MTFRHTLVRSAAAISAAGAAARLLGALYRPLLARLFAPWDGQAGALGMALAQIPSSYAQLVIAVLPAGLSVALSRQVAACLARADPAGARRAFRAALRTGAMAGGLAALALAWWAPVLADLSGAPAAAAGLRLIAPAILLTTVAAAYRGLFQGLEQMAAPAVCQVVETVVKVGAGVALVALWAPLGVARGAAGANLAFTAGTAAGLIGMGIAAARQRPLGPAAAAPDGRPATGGGGFAAALLRAALPVAAAGGLLPLCTAVDTVLVIPRLAAAGLPPAAATGHLGELAQAVYIIEFPLLVFNALYVSVVPAVTRAVVCGEPEEAAARAGAAYRIAAGLGLPAAAGIALLAEPISRVAFGGAGGGPVLAALAPVALLGGLQQVCAGILIGAGTPWQPFRHVLAGAAVKAGATWWLTPALGVRGAAWASVLATGTAAALHLLAARRRLLPPLCSRPALGAPLAATAAMAPAAWLAFGWLRARAAEPVALLLAMAAGGAVYTAAAALAGALAPGELGRLPGIGPALARLAGRVSRRG